VDLAVRGYLTIKEVKNGQHDWELVQIKDQAAGLLPYEAAIFNGLFDGKVKQTRLSALKGTFRFPLGQAEKLLYEDSVRLRWFTRNPQTTRVLWVFLGILVVLIGVGVALGLGALAGWGLLGVAVILVGSLIIATNSWMPRRTALGTDLFRKTLGFRVYMKAAEKERQAFAEKAEIFTQYLPYAIVYGCVHGWPKAFEGIDTRAAVCSWSPGHCELWAVGFAAIRGQAELPKHPQLVHDAPVLRNLAVGQLDDMCLRPLRVFSGGGHSKHLALVGPADGHIGSHEVPLGDLKIDSVGDVRKSLA